MQHKNIFSFDLDWNYKTVSGLILLLILPNLLGMINLPTAAGFKIHLFQVAVFIAAILYGPTGGALSGLVGSAFSGFIMQNPYLVAGNMILGFFVGLFVRYGWHTIFAVMMAFAIQLPWLVFTDFYLVGLPMVFITKLIIALAISNLVWAFISHYTAKQVRKAIK